jgi:hypothetical protein
MFASTMPGSPDIIVKVAAMERAYCPETPNWQFGDRGMDVAFVLKQLQSGVLHQVRRISSDFESNLC